MSLPFLATEDARYCESSQFREWSMSPAALAKRRRLNNETARDQITARFKQFWEATKMPEEDRKLPEFLTPEEEARLVDFNTNELLRAGSYLQFPLEAIASAAILFRRFYITSSIMTYPPNQILKTALFFGAKCEMGFDRVLRRFEKLPNTKVEEVLAGEYLLAMANKFAYHVHHPFRALEGAILELRRMGTFDEDRLTLSRGKARAILKFSPLITDAYFHFTPSQIMFAALSIADRQLAEKLIHSLFAAPVDADNTASGASTPVGNGLPEGIATTAMRDKVLGTVESCREMLKREPPDQDRREYWSTGVMQETKPLRRKLKFCHDPDRWDLVKLQQMRREQQSIKPKPGGSGGSGGGGQLAAMGDPFTDNGPTLKRRKVSPEDPFGPPLK